MANTKTNTQNTKPENKGTMNYKAKFYAFPTEGVVKGICTVTINDEIAVKGVKVVEGSKGLFMAMPSYKSGEEYKDICYPITSDGRKNLSNAVLDAYKTQLEEHNNEIAANGVNPDEEMLSAPEGIPMNQA